MGLDGPGDIRPDLRSDRGPPRGTQAGEQHDPDGSDPPFAQMVLIGRSLGGLLAKVMAQDSRSRLWETISAQPAARLDGPAEARAILRQVFFFKPLPGVHRLIFIAT